MKKSLDWQMNSAEPLHLKPTVAGRHVRELREAERKVLQGCCGVESRKHVYTCSAGLFSKLASNSFLLALDYPLDWL